MAVPPGHWASTSFIPASSDKTADYHAWASWVPGTNAAPSTSGEPLSSVSFRSTNTSDGKPLITAIQMFTTAHGWNGFGSFGYETCDEYTLALSPGEKITSYTLWQNGTNGGAIGRVRLLTDKGQTLDTAPNDTTLGNGYSRPVGGGILCGTICTVNNLLGIVDLCLLLIAPTVTQVNVTIQSYDVNYSGTSTGIQPVALESVYYKNVPNWTFGGTKSRSTTNSFTSQSTTSYAATASLEISGEFLGIGAKSSAGFTWTTTHETINENSVTEEVQLNYSASGTLDLAANQGKGEAITCTALVQQGTVNVGYTALVHLIFNDGTETYYTERGMYNNVSYSEVDITAIKDPPPTSP